MTHDTKAAEPALESSRAAFEHWYSEGGKWNAVERSGEGYKYAGAQMAWGIWQEATRACLGRGDQVEHQATGAGSSMITTQAQERAHQEWIDKVMGQAQVFASCWSLVGGRFDSGDALETAEAEKTALRAMLATPPSAAPAVPYTNLMSDSETVNPPPAGEQTGPVPARPAPVAFVPVHPRFGVLWSDAFPSDRDASESRPRSYPLMALYAAQVAENEDAALLDALILAEDVLSRSPYSNQMWAWMEPPMHPNYGITKIRDAIRAARKDKA